MRKLLVFVAVIVGGILLGAMVAYPVYFIASLFTEVRFEKVISRSSVICALITSLLYLRASGGWNLQGIGFGPPRDHWLKQFAVALAAGIALVLAMEGILLFFGVHMLDADHDLGIKALAIRAGLGLVAGILLGTLEELLFRGALYGAAERSLGAAAATFLTSVVYAASHYIKYPAPPAGEAIGWFTWIDLYPTALNWFSYRTVYDAMAALFLLGVLLSLLRRHFGNIIAGIGLHAGIVAALVPVKYATEHMWASRYSFLVSRYDNYQGWLACVFLILAIIALAVIDHRQRAAGVSSG